MYNPALYIIQTHTFIFISIRTLKQYKSVYLVNKRIIAIKFVSI